MSLRESSIETRSVHVPIETGGLEGDLAIPEGSRSIVLFAHGSGSSRHSPRNRFVAGQLQARALATLLFDLLTSKEEASCMLEGHSN